VARPVIFCFKLGLFMLDNKVTFLPISISPENPVIFGRAIHDMETEQVTTEDKKEDPLQRLLTDSSGDELAMQLKKNLHLSSIYLDGIVNNSVMVLSIMSAELGLVLRIQIRGECVPVVADFENIRRSINALIVHLLTLSKPQGCVTVGAEAQSQNGKRGMSVWLSSNLIAIPWKPDWEGEDGFGNPPEVSLSRSLLERNGGSLSVQWREDETLSYIIWIPEKGPRGK
jgi:hypothetical protein